MTKFEHAIRKTLEHEGGYVDHPDDPGGATNYGISLRWYRSVIDPNATVDDIKSLTIDDAKTLYRDHFWIDAYDRIFDERVAAKVFDMAVNMGKSQAHKLAQRAAQACGAKIEDDGILGSLSIAAINGIDAEVMLASLRATQAGWYRALANARPQFESFINGWLRRAHA
jgi:lysozyme family protein